MLNTANIAEQVSKNVVNMPMKGSEEQIAQRVKQNKKAKKQAEASNLIEDLVNKQQELMEELNITNRIPDCFFVNKNGIIKMELNDAGEVKKVKNISGTPIFIDRTEEDYDTHKEKVVLSFYVKGFLKKATFNSEDIASSQGCLKYLSAYGILIDSETAKDVTVYLRKLKGCNCKDISDNHVVFNSIGWKNNGKFFAYPTPEDAPVVIGDNGITFNCSYSDSIVDKFMQAKNTTIYRNTFLKTFDKNIYTQLACLTSLSGPFLELMDAPNILLYFYGKSQNAKTAIMRFAQSAWYNAEKNAVTFNSTSNALDNTLGLYSGTTLLIDERQSVAGDRRHQEKMLTQFIYSAVNGVGRARAQKNQDENNGLREVKKFHLSIMATGEERILGDDAKSGAQNRILEIPIEEQIFTHEEARDIYRVSKFSYGGFGVEFLKKALDLVKEENINLIEKTFFLQSDIFKLTNSEKSERQVVTISALAVVDYLLRRTIFAEDEVIATKHMDNFIKNTVDFLLSSEKTDEGIKSENLIDEFCTEYDSLIKDIKNTGSFSNTKVYGYKVHNEFSGDTKYYISTHVLKEYLDSRDESLNKLLKELYKKGLIEKYNETYKIRKSFKETDISGIFYVYTRKYQGYEKEESYLEERKEEIVEINKKIDEKHNVVREQPQPPQQQVLYNMQEEAQKTTVDDIFADDEERPW